MMDSNSALLVNRFKFLNLVQQIAKMDLDSCVDAVGLDALAYRSTSFASLGHYSNIHSSTKHERHRQPPVNVLVHKIKEEKAPHRKVSNRSAFVGRAEPHVQEKQKVQWQDDVNVAASSLHEQLVPELVTLIQKPMSLRNHEISQPDADVGSTMGTTGMVPPSIRQQPTAISEYKPPLPNPPLERHTTSPDEATGVVRRQRPASFGTKPKPKPAAIPESVVHHVANVLKQLEGHSHLSQLPPVAPTAPASHKGASINTQNIATGTDSSPNASLSPGKVDVTANVADSNTVELVGLLNEMVGKMLDEHCTIDQRTVRSQQNEQVLTLATDTHQEKTVEIAADLILDRERRNVDRYIEVSDRLLAERDASLRPAVKSTGNRGVMRGNMPRTMLDSILLTKAETREVMRYNEQLWNTSSISQTLFGERLTATLLDDLFSEVMQEVQVALDEYVDGLVEYEMQT